jgi:hypothetical protein
MSQDPKHTSATGRPIISEYQGHVEKLVAKTGCHTSDEMKQFVR